MWWLLTLTGTELKQLPEVLFRINDKVAHFALFCILSYLWVIALGGKLRMVFLVVLIAIIFGELTELRQDSIIGRVYSLYDEIANTKGILVGAAVAYIQCRFRRKS